MTSTTKPRDTRLDILRGLFLVTMAAVTFTHAFVAFNAGTVWVHQCG